MGCLAGDDVVREATKEKTSLAVFSASPPSRPTESVQSVQCTGTEWIVVSSWSWRQLRFRAVGIKSRGKKSACEDVACDWKTYECRQCSVLRLVAVCVASLVTTGGNRLSGLVWSDCKMCRIAIGLRLSVIKRGCNRRLIKFNHPK
jgi:hypothetical protein